MAKLDLSKEEMVLTTMLIIFCHDRCTLPDVEEAADVIQQQETYAMMLQQLMNIESQKDKRGGKNKFPVRNYKKIYYILKIMLPPSFKMLPPTHASSRIHFLSKMI